jgi:hypothetical protein
VVKSTQPPPPFSILNPNVQCKLPKEYVGSNGCLHLPGWCRRGPAFLLHHLPRVRFPSLLATWFSSLGWLACLSHFLDSAGACRVLSACLYQIPHEVRLWWCPHIPRDRLGSVDVT